MHDRCLPVPPTVERVTLFKITYCATRHRNGTEIAHQHEVYRDDDGLVVFEVCTMSGDAE